MITDELVTKRGKLSQKTLETLATISASDEAMWELLEEDWGFEDKDAPRVNIVLEHSYTSGKIKGARWAARETLDHTITVKAGRLWSDGDIEERLEFKMPRLEKFVFNN